MKLKKLELIGFKSFADKADFEFEGLFTGLVGPNGSGKSNVVDALKWVLGEQSARKLRGNEMSDMIFNGSDSRRALGTAEVRVTLDNTKGTLPVEYEEVCVARRCFRSGESTYTLNGKTCRLKDIRNLLLDTGVGVSAYSIIEQGQIDMLLQANSKEHRAVLEEAAGINRYLEQKKEAERKLEKVRDNLQRVSDIVEELEKQLRSIRRQAAKARRYKRYKDRQIRLRLAIGLFEKASLLKQKARIDKTLDDSNEESSSLRRHLDELNGKATCKESELERGRRELAAVEERISHLDARIYSLEKEKDMNDGRMEELKERIKKLELRHARLKESASSVGAELEAARENIRQGEGQLKSFRDAARGAKCELGTKENQSRSIREQVENGKNAVFRLMQHQSHLRNQLNMLHSELKTLDNRLRRHSEREQKLGEKLRILDAEQKTESDRLGNVQKKLHGYDRDIASVEDALSGTQLELDSLMSDMGDMKANLQGKMERRKVLEDLQARADGLGSGVRLLLEEISNPTGELYGCPGLLGNLIDVSTEYAKAAEAALGPCVQAVVVNTGKQAKHALDLLRKKGKGRAYVIALENLKTDGPATEKIQQYSGKAPRLTDIAGCSAEIKDVLSSIAGDCRIIENDCPVEARACGAGMRVRMVTRGGDLYDSNGVWAAGKMESGGVISRRSELAELKGEIEEIKKQLGALSEKTGQCSTRIEKLQAKKRRLTADKENLRKEEQNAGNRVTVVESQKKQVEEEILTLEEDAEALKKEKNEAMEGIKSGEIEAQALEKKKESREKDQNMAKVRLREVQEECETLRERLNVLEKQAGRLEEQQNSRKSLISRLQDQLAQGEEEINQVAAESAACRAEIDKTARNLEKAGSDSDALKEEAGSLKKTTPEKRTGITKLAEGLKNLQRSSKAVEEQLRTVEKQIQKTQLAENENRMKLENLHSRIEEDCGVDMDAFVLTPHQWREKPPFTDAQIEEFCSTTDDAGPGTQVAGWYAEANSRDRQQADDDDEPDTKASVKLKDAVELQKDVFATVQSPDTDWEKLGREAAELRKKIESMGGANLEAIREQDELEIRAQFLTDQREDLEKARRHELEIIRELSKKSRSKFASTFESVRQNFQVIIRKLFGGGSGDLILEQDAEDVLEAGIEISVRPPGKETRSISLLSGGEKALAAVALLFAIFEAKPSPFCLLDEVDAPLDEANVGRFLGLLEQYTEHTQFVLVTHNKLTMSAAETLYGVSLQDDGTSKKVAINFEEVDSRLKEMKQETARARAG